MRPPRLLAWCLWEKKGVAHCSQCNAPQVERLTLEVEWAGDPSVAPRDQLASTQPVWKPNPVAMWLPPETPVTKASASPLRSAHAAHHSTLVRTHVARDEHGGLGAQVLLTGTPLTVGMFTVVGCRVSALGVSWRQPWTPRTQFAANHSWQPGNSSMHSASARDVSGLAQVTPCATFIALPVACPRRATSRCRVCHVAIALSAVLHGRHVQARVSVVGPLPLVDARVEVPPSSVAPQDEAHEPAPVAAAAPPPNKRDGKAGAAAPEPVVQAVSAVALKGQVLKWWLNIANTGALHFLIWSDGPQSGDEE